jgi:hypothetical protein
VSVVDAGGGVKGAWRRRAEWGERWELLEPGLPDDRRGVVAVIPVAEVVPGMLRWRAGRPGQYGPLPDAIGLVRVDRLHAGMVAAESALDALGVAFEAAT